MQSEKPYTGDDRYWFHLLPAAEVTDSVLRPPQALLLRNQMVPMEMDLFHTYLSVFLSWIPTRSGNWEWLPEQFVVIDQTGATAAERIFTALANLFGLSPDPVSIPIPKMVYASGRDGILTNTHLSYSRATLPCRFCELARFSALAAGGSHIIFCSYWLERGE
jgi:hypothetical protein